MSDFGFCFRECCDLHPENCGHCTGWLYWREFWELCERQWAEYWKKWEFYPFNGVDDPDMETCPFCGLVGSCMCDELLQEQLDPEGLGLEESWEDYL